MLLNIRSTGHRILVLGNNNSHDPISSSRQAKLEAEGAEVINASIQEAAQNKCELLTKAGRPEVDGVVDAIFASWPETTHERELVEQIVSQAKRMRIPVNVTDHPDLCTFTLLASHRDGDFELGVTTNGQGCRLASRLKRHLVHALPPNVGAICASVGQLRRRIQEADSIDGTGRSAIDSTADDVEQTAEFNKLVLESESNTKDKRMRWLSQVVEYYPFAALEKLDESVFQEYLDFKATGSEEPDEPASSNIAASSSGSTKTRGRILLVGSGPGSESLLTKQALDAVCQADVILADKLVPSQVIDLVPRRTTLHIAKKFPGNAERAQEELMALGLQALEEGKMVVRLKQGDPYIFGRGAEEYVFFREKGYEPEVVSGITSALAALLYANIPATHRGVADQLLICTGTGRAGVLPDFPTWVSTRTTVFLMALHRIDQVVEALAQKGWDIKCPCAIIERATCPDQRIIRTTLEHVAEAVQENGSRPPGLLVTGYACEVIEKLKEGERWSVVEGLR